MKKVLVFGTFDILHPGHLYFLKQAKNKGDFLIVVIARDYTIKMLKGHWPVVSEKERLKRIKELKIADKVILGQHDFKKKYDIIEKIRPDIICLGYDQKFFIKNLPTKLKQLKLKTKIIRLKPLSPEKYKSSVLKKHGLIPIKKLDSSIVCDVRYATKNNFIKKQLYLNPIVFLHKKVAQRLIKVQKKLKRKGLGLKIWDGYRPLAVQWQMWKKLPDERYIADPRKGSFHNRGAAIDCTLVNNLVKELKMPTPFDEFSKRAHRNYPNSSKKVKENLKTLERAMISERFIPLETEWWHFYDPDWKNYPILDIQI